MKLERAATEVAVFGGSFDPPHVAHVLGVVYVLATCGVDEVLVVPCLRHPFAKELAPFARRFAMCELAMGWLPRTRISRVEEHLGGESHTLRTIERLRAQSPGTSFRLIVGADVLLDASRWKEFDRLRELAPLIVLGRAGVTADQAPPPILPDISSSAIRTAVRAGRRSSVQGLVPREVLDYIEQHGLYGG